MSMADKSGSDMIREALEAGVSKPAQITSWVQEKYQTEVKKSLINNVKQRYKNDGLKGGKKRRGRPAKNGNEAPVAPAAVQNGEAGKSQSELIRSALEGGVLKPADIITWVQQNHGVGVSRGLVNQVKHNWVKGQGRTKRVTRVGRPAGNSLRQAATAPSRQNGSEVKIEDILSVKALVGRLGKADLTKLIEVL
jgi:Arc/MetJ-type ribon-helix-helix transcriptional regulator